MSADIAKGIFRVFGCVTPGYLKVEYVRHSENPKVEKSAFPAGSRIIHIRDDLWVSEVPIELVPPESRMPNSLIELTVRGATQIITVTSYKEEPNQSPEPTAPSGRGSP
jgi:hypothetical protein